MRGTAFEADERDHTAGNIRPLRPDLTALPRRRAHTRQGPGTFANARPPIIRMVSRHTGKQRCGVCPHAETRTGAALIAMSVPAVSTQLYPVDWPRYRSSHRAHATVRRGVHEWGRDDDGDGRREVPRPPRCRGRRGTADLPARLRSIRRRCLGMEYPTKPWVTLNGSHRHRFGGYAGFTSQHTLVTHELIILMG